MVADAGGMKEEDYVLLTDAAKMALLNIEAKLRATRINGTPSTIFR